MKKLCALFGALVVGLLAGIIQGRSVEDLIKAEGMPAIKLGELDLRDKDLTSLTGLEMITNSAEVNALVLSKNKISTLPAGVFDKLTKLYWLALDNNPLIKLPAGILDKLAKLKTLDLPTTFLPVGVLDRLKSLERLTLGEITALPAGLEKLPNLKGLRFTARGAMPDISKLSRLEVLLFGGPQITALPGDILNNLTNLKQLGIANCPKLTMLPVEIFGKQQGLVFLGIAHTGITRLPALDNLTSLSDLDLQDNKLATSPVGLLTKLKNLKYLWIDKLPPEELKALKKALPALKIEEIVNKK